MYTGEGVLRTEVRNECTEMRERFAVRKVVAGKGMPEKARQGPAPECSH